jgi:periplasmic protein TonB
MLMSNASVLRRAPPSLLVVGGLHLVALWALLNGLNIHPLAAHPQDMTGTVIDPDPRPRDPPPPIDQPPIREITFTHESLAKVEIPIVDIDMPPQQIDTGVTLRTEPEPAAGTAEPQPVIARASVDPRHPLSQPDYPMEARHFGEQGRLLLAILVGTDGRVLDAKATESSGSERLDQAAIKEARQHWRLRPATRNGVPFEQWLTVPVVFRLEGR